MPKNTTIWDSATRDGPALPYGVFPCNDRM